ncbi:hypothetical protein SCHPADRAFT_482621 [Schizopora paradoxa]|uniref:Uncharacterized protein n=1 Tax=Schizopora paradoxa TaxID=27342 RepID=A0A0H2RH46_9AGAM|nr:hypothetical protein SCHPADRAFT_482621 [Schizopora paradoxa]
MDEHTLASDLELGWMADVSDFDKPFLEYWRSVAMQAESRRREQRRPFILRLPFDTLLDIFTMILPDSPENLNPPPGEKISRRYFETEVPYNVSRVCRRWREFVFTSPSLWSRFALSLRDPYGFTFRKAISYLSLHLEKSQDLPLSCSISLEHLGSRCRFEYDTKLLLNNLALHQSRWREIEFSWIELHPVDICTTFEDNEIDNNSGNPMPPNRLIQTPTISLFTEELNNLESFKVNHASLFNLQATKDIAEPGLIPSLRRLNLEMIDRLDKLAIWLERGPNIEELDVTFRPYDLRWLRRRGQRDYFHVPYLRFEKLQVININRDLDPEVDGDELLFAAGAGMFIVRFLVCPSLTRLSIKLEGDDCIHHLPGFLLRSSPSLQALDLHIVYPPSNGDEGQIMLVTRITEALSIIPSLTMFRLTSRSIDSVGLLLGALQSHTLLPSLEHIEFMFAYAHSSQFVDFIRSRCSGPKRVLKTFILVQCCSRRYGPRLPLFGPNSDASGLPKEWDDVKDLIDEGLRFEVI